jgi:hypothetical protein
MNLITELHTRTVLHVQVPPAIDSGDFEIDINICLPEGQTFAALRDGITVDADTLREYFDDSQTDEELDVNGDWHLSVAPFIRAVLAWNNETQPKPDEFFFHR